jgi:sirohydrochlorin ferrochelatase
MGLAPAVPLSDAIAEHLAATEGKHGLYAEIVAADPRLTFAVETLMREHAELRRTMQRDLTTMNEKQLAELSRRLDRHCQRGNDLVYEAYIVDLGGET